MTVAPQRSPSEVIQEGARVLREEARAILELADRLDHRFHQAVVRLADCTGAVIVTGMGKSGLVGRKFSATLSSTGTRSFFVHPGEALHGDLGCLNRDDAVVLFSYSGETEELVKLLPALDSRQLELIAVTQRSDSTLGRSAALVIELGYAREACEFGLVPTCSSAMMMAIGDALALAVGRIKGFGRDDYQYVHPAGAVRRSARAQR